MLILTFVTDLCLVDFFIHWIYELHWNWIYYSGNAYMHAYIFI